MSQSVEQQGNAKKEQPNWVKIPKCSMKKNSFFREQYKRYNKAIVYVWMYGAMNIVKKTPAFLLFFFFAA